MKRVVRACVRAEAHCSAQGRYLQQLPAAATCRYAEARMVCSAAQSGPRPGSGGTRRRLGQHYSVGTKLELCARGPQPGTQRASGREQTSVHRGLAEARLYRAAPSMACAYLACVWCMVVSCVACSHLGTCTSLIAHRLRPSAHKAQGESLYVCAREVSLCGPGQAAPGRLMLQILFSKRVVRGRKFVTHPVFDAE